MDRLNRFFEKEYHLEQKNMKIIIHTPFKNNKFCSNPIFSLINDSHYFGWLDLILDCNMKRQYLKVELQATGKYVVAKEKIIQGTKIKNSDLTLKIGRLDKLPHGTYFNIVDVIDKVNLRDIFPYQPITSFIMRSFWIIKANQQVTVKICGVDFEIITSGKSLGNFAYNEKIRVRMKNNKIIDGVVNKNGEVIVVL